MIKSFANAAARAAWERRFIKGMPHDVMRAAYRKLVQLHAARSLQDLRAPSGNRLEALKGGSRRAAFHPHQPAMAHLLCLACWQCA